MLELLPTAALLADSRLVNRKTSKTVQALDGEIRKPPESEIMKGVLAVNFSETSGGRLKESRDCAHHRS